MTLPRLGSVVRRPFPRGRTNRPPGALNATERRYLAHLEARQRRGEIAGLWPHPFRLQLAPKTTYQPDFLVMLPDGRLELHEVKGWMQDDAAVKLKVTSEIYWLFPVYVVREKPRGVFTLRSMDRA